MADDRDLPLEELASEKTLPEEQEGRSRPLFRTIGIILISLSVMLGVYGTVAYLAWQRSHDLQAENARTILLEEIEEQIGLARTDVAAGNTALAQRRLEWILERDPENSEALNLKREIEQQLMAPTPTPRPTPTEPAVVEDEDDELAQTFDRLEGLSEDGLWSEAISAIIAFQSDQPNYRRQDTDRMLYEAYLNLGQELLQTEQVELGLNYLAQAETLGDLPQEVEDQRLWAELYLMGIAYYGVDWGISLSYFRDLCAAAPFYQNSCQRLREGLIALADGYASNRDWCPAELLYVEANQLDGDRTLSEKVTNARQMCLQATPTPSAPITDTENFSGTLPSVISGAANGEGEGQ